MNIRMFPDRQNCNGQSNCATTRSGAPSSRHSQKQAAREEQVVLKLSSIRDASSLSQVEQERLLRQQALDSAQQGKYTEAIALLSHLIERNSSNASDFNNRGLLHYQAGHPKQALVDYNKALQLNPRLAKVYNNRANCYASLGQLAEAISDYGTAIDLDPANIHAWINQGITFRDLEMYSQALENFDLALQFNQMFHGSEDANAPTSREGHIYAERGRTHHLAGDWNCAVADYQRALTALPPALSSSAGAPYRLRFQVENWLDDLLKPLLESLWEEDAEL